MGQIKVTVEAACEGKEVYPSAVMAQAVVKRRTGRGQAIKAYRCPFCGSWHIGSRQRTARQFHKSKWGRP